MKIVDRKTFLALPPNTVYAKYEPCVFGDLHIKGESWVSPNPGDWWEVSLADAIDFHDTGQFCADLERARETGCSLKMDFECETRDGLYDEHQLFAVFEPQDVAALIARLQKCVPAAWDPNEVEVRDSYGPTSIDLSAHPVDALKQCGVEMTAEQEAQMRAVRDEPVTIRTILDGIDKTQVEYADGWWETSAGAEFGAKKLAEVEAFVAALPQAPMSVTQARKICEDRDGFDLWIKNGPDGIDRAVVDARYTANELEAIAVLMRAGEL